MDNDMLGSVAKIVAATVLFAALTVFAINLLPSAIKNLSARNELARERKILRDEVTVNKETGEVSIPVQDNGDTVYINITVDNIESIETLNIDQLIKNMDIDNIENIENMNIETGGE